ncbi:AIR synthase related protein [Streptomyces sp. AC555_RSS877]|uniref:AIR synthase related protein n=1 Tax=Streptomyces sp. AC555_RSS877 TaxID=2823688 RepID=UPI001C27B31B|nr:AIR synthase related protein [Streptomyces sp. AC555_RSS877]
MRLRVFLSFEHAEKGRAAWFAEEVSRTGMTVIMEDDFGAASPRVEMTKAVQACDVVVALITDAYARSRATQRELDLAEAFGKKVVAVFTSLPSRSVRAEPYSAYRRVEVDNWQGGEDQWKEALRLTLRLLLREDQELQAAHTAALAGAVPPDGHAVLLYDIEDRSLAERLLMVMPHWRRKTELDDASGSALPRVLLWTRAAAEPYSLTKRELFDVPSDSIVFLAVADDSPIPEIEAPSFSVSGLLADARYTERTYHGADIASQTRVEQLIDEVVRANEGTPISVFVERFCCTPDVAVLASEAYDIAVRELNAGDPLRLAAVHHHALSLRFRGEWRKAVEMINDELLATPQEVEPRSECLRLHLRLELASLQYELGDRRSAGIEKDIKELQLRLQSAGDLPGYVQAGRVLGNVLRERGDFDPAELVIQHTIGLAEYLADSRDGDGNGHLVLADCLRELAQLHVARMDYARARACLRDAAQRLDCHHGGQSAVRYLSAILTYVDATIDERDGQQSHADSPTERARGALEALSEFENPIRLAAIYDWLGRAWTRHIPSRREDLLRAEEYLRKALRIRKDHGHSYTMGLSHLSLGGLYEVLGHMDQALQSYELGRQIFNQRGLRPALARAHAALARGYFGSSHQLDDRSVRLYQSHLEQADRIYHEIHLDNEGMELRFELEHRGRRPFSVVPDETPLIAVGEYHLHKWIRDYVAVHGSAIDSSFTLTVGIGDDAAVISSEGMPEGCGLVYTTDSAPGSLAETGRSPEYVGRFSVVQSLSDLLSMGATPVGVMLNLFLKRSATVGYVRRLVEAVVQEAARYGVAVIGGDVKERPEQSVGCVGIGYVDRSRILTRDAARQGHALGITLASDPSGGHRRIGTRWAQELVEYFRMDRADTVRDFPGLRAVIRTEAKYDLLYLPDKVMSSATGTGKLKAAIDTSDGVLACLEIMGRESSVGFVLEESAINATISAEAVALADILNVPQALFLFNAGHDWETVFTCKQEDFTEVAAQVERDLQGNGTVVRIGSVVARQQMDDRGVLMRQQDGVQRLVPYYTDEKFVPRRYQDRPSQWLTFAKRFSPQHDEP